MVFNSRIQLFLYLRAKFYVEFEKRFNKNTNRARLYMLQNKY
jgi:hypothetical protein